MKHNLSSHFATDATYAVKTQLGNKHGVLVSKNLSL